MQSAISIFMIVQNKIHIQAILPLQIGNDKIHKIAI